jgi:hypothetical protein
MTSHVERVAGAVAARGEAESVEAIATHGLTERQARFLVTVMLHSGVFVGRQYAAFTGITHGQKVHDFIEKLLVRRFVTAIKLGSTPTGRADVLSDRDCSARSCQNYSEVMSSSSCRDVGVGII